MRRTARSSLWFLRNKQACRSVCAVGSGCGLPLSQTTSSTGSVITSQKWADVDNKIGTIFRATRPLLQQPQQQQLYQCSACQKTFRLANALNHHIATKHGGNATILVVDAQGKPIEGATVPGAAPAAQQQPAAPSAPPQQPTSSPASGDGKAATTPATATSSTPAAPQTESDAATTPAAAATTSGGEAKTQQAPPTPPQQQQQQQQQQQKVFVCTICQKTFRLEAALLHHYMAKHNMEMPGASSSSSAAASSTSAASPAADGSGGAATSGADASQSFTAAAAAQQGSAASAAAASAATAAAVSPNGTQYFVAPQGSAAAAGAAAPATLPEAPQFHLDIAPGAPLELEVAAHSRCVNHTLLIGTVQDVQQGYVFEDAVTQFVIATDFENPNPGDPDKDFHTVRCFGKDYSQQVKDVIKDGDVVCVSGKLRLIPQFEAVANKFYHYPVVHVEQGGVTVL